MSDDHEPQLSNPTKERVKGPVGRRLPTKKAQGVKAITEEADQDQDQDVSAALREFRTAAKRVREAREADEKDKKYEKDEKDEKAERKHEVNDMSRQGIVDPADFDRAWFFRVPSFSWHNSDTTTAAKRSKSDPTDVLCENNNMSNNNNNNSRDSAVVPNSTNEEVGPGGGDEPEIGSREGSSDASEGKKRRFWKNREFNCNIL